MGCDDFAPSFRRHMTKMSNGTAPDIYTVFLSITGPCLLITLCIVMPHLWKIRKAGYLARDQKEEILVPNAYKTVSFICFYPVVQCAANFSSLLVPFSEPAMAFFAAFYQGLCFFEFSRLIIMFLGNYKTAYDKLKQQPPHKIWTVPPLGCCCKCCSCCKETNVSPRDLRLMDSLIAQNAIINPGLSLISLFLSFQGSETTVLSVLSMMSTLLGLYGVMALVTAVGEVIKERNPTGKFGAIQVIMVVGQLVPGIIGAIGVDKESDLYDSGVMTKAWSAFIVCILATCLCWLFPKSYTIEDCEIADQMSRGFERAKSIAMMSPDAATTTTIDG